MRFSAECYRAHDPKWSFEPLSGEGATRQGGRFNRRGRPALYLSLDLDTAIREASQGFSGKLQPLTLCSYAVDCEDIADLRGASGRANLAIDASDLSCPWMLQRDSGLEPPSWAVAERLQLQGVAGILVPSYAKDASPTASNLVLWRWDSDRHRVRVNDENGRLPIDQSSWPRSTG